MIAALLLAAAFTAPPELQYSTSTSTTINTGEATCTETLCHTLCRQGIEDIPWCLALSHCGTPPDNTCYCQHECFPPYPGARMPRKQAKSCEDISRDATWQQ